MKKLFLNLSLLFMLGCGVNQKFVKSVDENWNAIRPEYVDYVKNDENLTEQEKSVKMLTVELFNRLITEAKNE